MWVSSQQSGNVFVWWQWQIDLTGDHREPDNQNHCAVHQELILCVGQLHIKTDKLTEKRDQICG